MTAHAARRWVATRPGSSGVLALVPVTVPVPGPGEVTIDVRAAGVNPADYKSFAAGEIIEPMPIGSEVSGVLREIGPETTIASGRGRPGDEVLAFRVAGGYATRLTARATDVFAKPDALDHPAAANLLLAGTTAAEMLAAAHVGAGDTIVLHGASGAVGVSVLQQAARLGARVVGTASPAGFETVRSFGATPVAYGDGLESRLRDAGGDGYAAALDAAGTDEAVGASLALVRDRRRIVTIVAAARAGEDGFVALSGGRPESAAFRAGARAGLIAMAARGELVVPVARTVPFEQAPAALDDLRSGRVRGKLALVQGGADR